MDEIALVFSSSTKGNPTGMALYAHSILPVIPVRYPKKHRGRTQGKKCSPSKMKKMGGSIGDCSVIFVD